MRFGIIQKNCLKCGCEISTQDNRVKYCTDCYLDEFECLEEYEGDFNEKKA